MNGDSSSRILVLGAGAVVQECFLPALGKLGLIERTTVVDASPAVAGLADRHPGLSAIQSDFREYLDRAAEGGFEYAIVALPNALHEDAVLRAAGQGLHILCEKPLAMSSKACSNMGRAAEDAGRVLAVNMVRRLIPSVRSARMAVELGLIGDIESIDIEHGSPYAWPVQSLAPFQKENGGILADMGVHYLDLAEMFLGPLTPLEYEDDARGGVEADLTYALETAAGARLHIRLSRLRTLRNSVVITGARGRLEWNVDDLDTCALKVDNREPLELRRAGGGTSSFIDCFERQLQDFLECARLGNPPATGAWSAAQTATLIEWAYAKRQVRPFRAKAAEAAPVLVTGATSFIGSHLIEALFERGVSDIVAAVRSPMTCARIARYPVRLKYFDLLDAAGAREAVRGVRHVFHLAYGRDGAGRRKVTVDGTKNVVNAAIEEGCESVVILSTAYVFGRPDETVTEEHPYRPAGGEYGASKAEMERWCLKRARTSGRTRLIVLNPSCVYGPWGATYSELPASLAREQAFCWVDGGNGNANYTFASNLVDAILLASQKPDAHGHRFLINDGAATWRQFLGPIVENWQGNISSFTKDDLLRMERQTRHGVLQAVHQLSANPDVRSIVKQTTAGAAAASLARRYFPSAIVPALKNGALSEPAQKAASGPRPPSWLADLFGNSSTVYSSEKARTILGWRPEIDLAEGQRRTLRHLEYLYSPRSRPVRVAVPSSTAEEAALRQA